LGLVDAGKLLVIVGFLSGFSGITFSFSTLFINTGVPFSSSVLILMLVASRTEAAEAAAASEDSILFCGGCDSLRVLKILGCRIHFGLF
jgi:hypothetical protein